MNTNAKLDNYIILKTLGTGFTGKVKLGRDIVSGHLRALKILDPSRMDPHTLIKATQTLENESRVLSAIEHPNIIKVHQLVNNSLYTPTKGKSRQVSYAVVDLAAHGEVFNILLKIGSFNENMARHYINQVVSAITHIHSNKIAHRDLKLENLLLDENFDVKLADFGFSTSIKDDVKNRTKLGTDSYMSPEMHASRSYDATKADIFALGVMLFIMYAGYPPFNDAKEDDPYYKAFINRPQKFWDFHTKKLKNRTFSEKFKQLVSNMLELNPDIRVSIEEVQNSEWLNESIDHEGAKEDMAHYVQLMTSISSQTENSASDEPRPIRALADLVVSQPQRVKVIDVSPSTDYDCIKCVDLVPAELSPTMASVKCTGKTKLVDLIVRTVEQIQDCQIAWNELRDGFSIKRVTENGDILIVKARVYRAEDGTFSVDFANSEGPADSFQELKQVLRDAMAAELRN